jgi:hypothetical protein
MRTVLTGVAVAGTLFLGVGVPARAQYAPPGLALSGAPKPTGVGGFRVGESTYLRAGVAAEAGYDSNVFYNDEDKQDSATLRVTPSFELTNSMRDGNTPPLYFSLGAALLYREYLKDDPNVRQQRAFNPTAFGTLGYKGASSTLSLSDQFTRLEEPPYTATTQASPTSPTVDTPPIIRDTNQAVLDLAVSPGGGRITSTFRYSNLLDLYETDGLDYGNRMMHELLVDGAWKWLPKTALFLQAAGGYVQYLEESTKSDSISYRFMGGLRGLITPKFTASIGAGYSDAIYRDPPVARMQPLPNPSGLSNLAVQVALTYTPVTYTNVVAAYGHEFRDSPLLGDFYDLDFASLTINQQLGAFVLSANGRYEYRRYKGMQIVSEFDNATSMIVQSEQPVGRNDHIWQTSVQADYFLQRWFYAGVGYANLINRSTVPDGFTQAQANVGVNYTKHLIVGRIGVTY